MRAEQTDVFSIFIYFHFQNDRSEKIKFSQELKYKLRQISKLIWGKLMTERVIFILKYLLMKKEIGLQQKAHFSHPGQKGRSLSTTRGLSVQVPGF